MVGEERMSSALRHLLPAGLLLALTLLAYHPLTWQLGSKTLGGQQDRYIFLWDLWWVRHTLLHLHHTPLHTDFLFFPEGCSLAFHTLSLASGLCGLLAGPSADLILTYNLLLLLSTFLGGLATFLLLRTLTGFAPGALLGAVIFVFSPPLWTAIFHGQMNIWSIQWVPLFLWLLVRFLRTPGPGRSLPAALCLAAIFYTGFQQFVFTVLLALMIVPAERRQWRNGEISRRARVRGAAAGLALFLLLAAPMALEMNRSCEGSLITPEPEQMHELSIRPGRLLCNQIRNRWWRHWDAGGPLGPLAGVLERTVPRHGPMFGYVPCLLLVAGWMVLLIRGRADFSVRYWSLMTAILAWLPLGTPPGLLLLQHLPGLCAIRGLYRYCIPLALALAILSAFLCRALFSPSAGVRPRFWKPALCVLLALMTWLEYWNAPLRLSEPPAVPAAYLAGGAVRESAAIPACRDALIELPYWTSGGDFWLGIDRRETLYYQTFHRMRMVGGHHSRMTGIQVPRAVSDPALVFLASHRPEQSVPPRLQQVRETFRHHRIRFATLDRTCYTPAGEAMICRLLESGLGGELLHRDRRFLTYRFDPVATLASAR
jgi:hypothetical protein